MANQAHNPAAAAFADPFAGFFKSVDLYPTPPSLSLCPDRGRAQHEPWPLRGSAGRLPTRRPWRAGRTWTLPLLGPL